MVANVTPVSPQGRVRGSEPERTRSNSPPVHSGCMRYLGDTSVHGDGMPRPPATNGWQNTEVRPFSFDKRDQDRPKTILQVCAHVLEPFSEWLPLL